MSLALIPGSFDPMTVGHLDIVKRALALYDEVVVAVMVNDQKTYAHSLRERTEMAELTVKDLERVRVVSSEGLLVDLFDQLGADVIVKGIRNERDRAYEEKMAEWNLSRNPRAVTIFLQAADDYEQINSTHVRELIKAGKHPENLVVPAVAAYLTRKEEGEKS
ncbi:MAG: pantetheine-phosphate adenylyltransferase [Ruminococcaceae bacterium]|nr:pantetheine-phosphate adenylyltransferase [Oscillospiraceae bacterium]